MRPKHETATFEKLNLWYFGDAAQRRQPESEPSSRIADFGEVTGGLTGEQARYEAGRCLSCGNCFECDGCLGSCPEDAVLKLGVGLRYRFNYDRCTGCQSDAALFFANSFSYVLLWSGGQLAEEVVLGVVQRGDHILKRRLLGL